MSVVSAIFRNERYKGDSHSILSVSTWCLLNSQFFFPQHQILQLERQWGQSCSLFLSPHPCVWGSIWGWWASVHRPPRNVIQLLTKYFFFFQIPFLYLSRTWCTYLYMRGLNRFSFKTSYNLITMNCFKCLIRLTLEQHRGTDPVHSGKSMYNWY